MSLPEVSFVDIPLGPQSLLQRLSGSAKKMGSSWGRLVHSFWCCFWNHWKSTTYVCSFIQGNQGFCFFMYFNIRRETSWHEREGGSKIIRRRFMFESKFSTNKALHAPNSWACFFSAKWIALYSRRNLLNRKYKLMIQANICMINPVQQVLQMQDLSW